MKKVTIIGSGSWGIALAIHLAKMGHKVKVWSFAKEEADLINNERKCKFLPNVNLPEGIECVLDYKEAIEGSEIILHVTPSKFTRSTVKEYKQYVTNQPIIICSKGFEKETLLPLDEVIRQEMPNAKIGVLSGPSHAEEVSIGIPTVMVIASEDDEILYDIQNEFMTPEFRIYTSHDIRGVEIGGAFKNIIAFCAGVAAGINLGDNSFAALITRGLGEIARLGIALGAEKDTLYGLSGLGDLIVTCLSEHSRNRRAGKLIGEGKTIEEARKEVGMVIESIDNIEAAYELSKIHNIEMPIVDGVYNILYNNLDPREAVTMLMTRAKVEVKNNVVGQIDKGYMVLLGVKKGDTEKEADYLAKKLCNLRIFEDDNGKMNLSIKDVNGELLIISQFTLYGNTKEGNRPSFIEVEEPEKANELYKHFLIKCKENGIEKVEQGMFGEHMEVSLINDGPNTIIMEK